MTVRCALCDPKKREFRTTAALYHHTRDAHGEDAAAVLKIDLDAEKKAERVRLKAQEAAAKAHADAESARLRERSKRVVTVTTTEIDEIVEEMRSLINMMEPYYAQGDCYKDAEALIERLEKLADGKTGGLTSMPSVAA